MGDAVGGLWARLAWAKMQDPIQKITKAGKKKWLGHGSSGRAPVWQELDLELNPNPLPPKKKWHLYEDYYIIHQILVAQTSVPVVHDSKAWQFGLSSAGQFLPLCLAVTIRCPDGDGVAGG
jgi:hypothetical protein